jgi:nucleoside-diphosphate-sugar epimerase
LLIKNIPPTQPEDAWLFSLTKGSGAPIMKGRAKELAVSERKNGWSVEQLRAKAQLPNNAGAIPCDKISMPIEAGSIIGLTGATGWWGRHAARYILSKDPHAQLIVPVRANSIAQGREKIRVCWANTEAREEKADRQGWWARTTVLAIDDLAQTRGLPCPRQMDAVIHAAANRSRVMSMGQAWQDNVDTTQQVWEWAKKSGAKRFDHISALSVWVASARAPGRIGEDEALEEAGHLWGAYAATKWVAEAWLAAQTDGPALAVHRMGLLAYSPSDGWADDDGIAAIAMAWQRWGRPGWAWPSGRERVDWTPVDKTVEGVWLAMTQGSIGAHHWGAEQAMEATAMVGLLDETFGSRAGRWPGNDPLGKRARRALGRWADPARASRFWWHDIFQSDRHRYGAERAEKLMERWNWSEQEFLDALGALPIKNPGAEYAQ